MDEATQERADARYEARLAESGARDPREFYRSLLRELKLSDPEGYDTMVTAYRSDVLEPIAAGDGDPLVRWLAFGIRLAERLHEGTTVLLESDGRAIPYTPPPDPERLLLHLPKDARTRAIPLGIPPEPTPAQAAALDLLVKGKTRLAEAS